VDLLDDETLLEIVMAIYYAGVIEFQTGDMRKQIIIQISYWLFAFLIA
jgi:hypothetical protein